MFPSLLEISTDRKSLLLQPEGMHFANNADAMKLGIWSHFQSNEMKSGEILASSDTICRLIDALKFLHSRSGPELVHRDIKLSNIFTVSAQRGYHFLLNDFGAAVKVGEFNIVYDLT